MTLALRSRPRKPCTGVSRPLHEDAREFLARIDLPVCILVELADLLEDQPRRPS